MEEFKYILQDPDVWISMLIDIGFSILALNIYVIFKVWVIRNELNLTQFITSNKSFWLWHLYATTGLSVFSIVAPDEFLSMLGEFGVAVQGDYSFISIGFALAGMAYGDKKKQMLEQIKQSKIEKAHNTK